MTVPVLASLLCGVIVGQAAGLLAFMLYHRRGIRVVLLAALAIGTFVGIGFAYQAAMVGLPLLQWLDTQRPQILAVCLSATPMFVATFAFWNWYTKRHESDVAGRHDS